QASPASARHWLPGRASDERLSGSAWRGLPVRNRHAPSWVPWSPSPGSMRPMRALHQGTPPDRARGVRRTPGLLPSPAGSAEDQVDRELGAPAVADFADVKAAHKQCVHNVANLAGDLEVTADQGDAVAAP